MREMDLIGWVINDGISYKYTNIVNISDSTIMTGVKIAYQSESSDFRRTLSKQIPKFISWWRNDELMTVDI